jgi:hypothetical protein
MWQLPSLLPGGEEYPWSSSRLIRRRPGVDDRDDLDDVDVEETTSESTPVALFTAADYDSESDGDGGDVIAKPPQGDQETLYGEYQLTEAELHRQVPRQQAFLPVELLPSEEQHKKYT